MNRTNVYMIFSEDQDIQENYIQQKQEKIKTLKKKKEREKESLRSRPPRTPPRVG